MVLEHGIADARQLVGQRAGRLVVVGAALDLERPVLEVVDLPACRATPRPSRADYLKHYAA